MIRGLAASLAALLLAAAAFSLAQAGPAEVEEAADVARRAALDLLRVPQARLFSEALDLDGILVRRVGADGWSRLTERQKDRLRGAVRDRFVHTLSPPRDASADIAWSGAQPAANGVDVFFGLRFDARVLKTRWSLRKVGGGWRVVDIVLSDPGVSLAQTAETSLGPVPLLRRTPAEEGWASALPRAGAIVVIVVFVLLVGSRISREKRRLLWWTAAAPAALLAIDGALAIHRAVSEPFTVRAASSEKWHQAEQLAFAAEQEGRPELAREHWARALSEGGPAGPIEYQIGLAARRHGDVPRAHAEFERALGENPPAPGAAKELASIEVEQGRFAAAEPLLIRYLALTGPDPDALSLLAVVQTNLDKSAQALETIRQARTLMGGERWRGEDLEAQVHARAGDAAGAVAALRAMDAQAPVDRSKLRADPAYLPIATDPVWVAFLNEKPKP